MAPPLARTVTEARLFLALLPCERCGATDTSWEFGAMLTVDGVRADSYSGDCPQCGRARDFTFAIPGMPAAGSATGTRFGGDQPSELLDAGQWLDVGGAARIGGSRADDPRAELEDLELALDAFREALKFVPPGADAVPASALSSEAGQQRLAADPVSLTLDYLQAQVNTLAQLVTERGGDPGRTGEVAARLGVARTAPPRFDHPEDVQRARRWLRGQLLVAARDARPDGDVLVEHDDGPVQLEPGPDDEPGRYLCRIAVTVSGRASGWDPAEAVTRAGRELAEAGWDIFLSPRREGSRWEVGGRRDGFVAQATMLPGQDLLRFSGETPMFLLPPVEPPALGAAGAVDEPWQAATEQEEILEHAYRQGDTASVLRLLHRLPLYVPVADNRDDPGRPAAYGTIDLDNEVYLAAYTSPGSLEYGLGPGVSYQETTFRRLAESWPDAAWGLAVNGGSPIEVYLPPDEVLTGPGGPGGTPPPA